MTNAPIQTKDNNDIVLSQMLNIKTTDKIVKKDEKSFSNLINTTNANVEKAQSNFISKASKSNTSSINKLALKPPKKILKINKQQNKFQNLNTNYNTQTQQKDDVQKISDNVYFLNPLDQKQDTKAEENFNYISNDNIETENSSSDINNSSPVNPSPVFYSDFTQTEENTNTSSVQENNNLNNLDSLKDAIQNVLMVADIDINENDFKKIEDAISNIETTEDFKSAIQIIENIFQTSNNFEQNKDDIQKALDKIKDLIKSSSEKIQQNHPLDSTESKELLNDIFLKMMNNKPQDSTSSREIGKISQEEIKAILKQMNIEESDSEVLKDTIQNVQKLLNTAQSALDNNDFKTLSSLSEDIKSAISDLEEILNNTAQKPKQIVDFSKDLKEALKNLDETIDINSNNTTSQTLNSNEISSALQTLKEVELPKTEQDSNTQKLNEEPVLKLNEIDFDKLKNEDTKKIKDILELLNNSDDETKINTDDLIKQINEIIVNSNNENASKDETEVVSIEPEPQIETIQNTQNETLQKPQIKEDTKNIDIKESSIISDDKNIDEDLNFDENLSQEDFSQKEDETISKKEVSEPEKDDDINIQKSNFIKELDEDILLDIDYEPDNQSALSVSDEIIRLSMNEENSLNSNNPVGNITYDNNVLIKSTPHEINIHQTHTQEKTQPTSDIFNQIGDKLTQLKDGSQKLTMVLRPNDLGRLSIELTTNDSGLSANILAQNDDVRAYIEKNINTLKQQLSDSGVNVNSIQIKTSGSSDSTNYTGNQNENSQEQNKEQGFNGQDNQNHQNRQNQKQKQETLAQMSNYDLHFAKDFSTIMNKTISYNLN